MKRRSVSKESSMEPEKVYDLRSRSRSRSETPNLFSNRSEDGSEPRYDLRRRSSRERSMTPAELDSRRSSSRSLPGSVVKNRVKNMDIIVENSPINDTITNSFSSDANDNTTIEPISTIEKTVTKSTRKSERRSESQKVKKQLLLNGQSENKDGSLDSQSGTKSKTRKRIITSDYSSEEGEKEEVSKSSSANSAYEFYKQHPDYWNKFPKTDYTYSKTSKCRYEVAPGVMARPNMSRCSLHSEGNNSFLSNSQSSLKDSSMEENNIAANLNNSKSKNTDQFSVSYKKTMEYSSIRRDYSLNNSINDNKINERYEAWATPLLSSHSRSRISNNLDSDTEMDELDSVRQSSKISTFVSFIWTCISAVFHFVTFGYLRKQSQYSSYTSHSYRRYEETKWQKVKSWIGSSFRQVYLTLVNVMLLDTWLLSKATNIRQRAQGRRSKILWLVLLPLLCVIGCWFLPHSLAMFSFSTENFSWWKQKADTPEIFSSQSHQRNVESNLELKRIVEQLITRVHELETNSTRQYNQLVDVDEAVNNLKNGNSEYWKLYESKLSNLKQEVDESSDSNRYKSEEIASMKVELENMKSLFMQLKTCCESSATKINEEDIKRQADEVFTGYFGDSISKHDIVRIFQIMNSKIQQEESNSVADPENTALGIDEIRRIVLGILKIYDADKTGKVDFALESAGGQVISTRCTQRYNMHTRAFKILGLTLYYESNNPRTVIQGNTLQPGMCWAFQDFPGYLLIKLRSPIFVTGFTLEHAPKANLPNGEMKSAPKKFNVWGLTSEHDAEPVMFGEYEFVDSNDSLQYFPVQNTSITWPYEYVELRIHSNHGQLDYTCLYRFRVHGNIA
ncbi:uncharacterized protein LOC106657517 isoform X1 [Trichogramma pretiosum]|uniref:uncharacterized protein LOC106657517 isoform X1 n=2 Tax=Trichogramma pretiosum TaxID=7493 RepID=UPI0006C9C64B|nr:uncharacterized protein LOC106657517 isoform X1 [Trichogramma pretiosum]